MDEIQIVFDNCDFSSLKVHFQDIDVLMAINPALESCEKVAFQPPNEPSTIFQRLTYKYRQSQEISTFVLHFLKLESKYGSLYKQLESYEDSPLALSTLPSGNLPILVKTTCDVDDETILDTLEKNLILDNVKDVLLIYDTRISIGQRERFKKLAWICQNKNWNMAQTYHVMGFEASVVIAYFSLGAPEILLRAKYQLIMVEQ